MRAEKQIINKEYLDWLQASPFFILVDYTGLKVGPITELRKRLTLAEAEMHVVKNSIFRRAAQEAGVGDLGVTTMWQNAPWQIRLAIKPRRLAHPLRLRKSDVSSGRQLRSREIVTMSTFNTLFGPGERQMAKRKHHVDSKNFSEWLSRGVQLLRSPVHRIR